MFTMYSCCNIFIMNDRHITVLFWVQGIKNTFGAFLANSFSFTLVLLWAQCFKKES